jgi:heme-degrading monooxygenase HmoA
MVKFVEMDANVPLFVQMEDGDGPVVLINKFDVAPDDVEEFLKVWAADAAFMKRQPGLISTQFHRGIGGSCVFLNYAVWESVEAYRAAFAQPEFQEALSRYPESAVASPHLFRKVAVPGVCTG